MLGIHGSPVRSIPLFLVYLATLFHTYGLATRHAAGGDAGAPTPRPTSPAAAGGEEVGMQQGGGDLEAGAAPASGGAGGSGVGGQRGWRRRSSSGGPYLLGEALGSSVSGRLQHFGLWLLGVCYAGEALQHGPCFHGVWHAALT